MIDGATAVDNKPSAIVKSQSYFEQSRDMRKTILQLIVDSKGLVTMFSPCLMDLSYLTLKENTADDRRVRTQHILERTHNDDEF